MVRFSENNAGKLAISYRAREGVHHYLLTEDDQKKCLLECVTEKHRLAVLLRYKYSGGDEEAHITCCAKDDLAGEFQRAKKKKLIRVADVLGYEAFIE